MTMTVREFIKALIQHIPDRNFKMILRSSAEGTVLTAHTAVEPEEDTPGTSESCLKQAIFDDFLKNPNK